MNDAARNRRAVVLGALILAAAIAFTQILRPMYGAYLQARNTLVDQRILLGRERALVDASTRLPTTQREIERVMAGEQARLFEGDSVSATAALTEFTADVARATGVKLFTLETRPPRTDSAVTRLSIDLRGEGRWPDVLAFTRVLESSARLVHISSIRIERGARGGPLGGTLVSISATFTAFALGTQ